MRWSVRRMAACLLLCIAPWTEALAGSAYYGTAVVEGRTADRVHLRAEPSTGAASLGLYYSGTQVECRSGTGGSWVYVQIGNQTGYIMSQYLYDGYYTWTIEDDAPRASAAYGTQLMAYPNAASGAVYTITGAEALWVLGETWDHWCYVQASTIQGGSARGYVPAAWLSVGQADHSGSRMSYGLAVIDGGSADRVHLRAEATTASASQGLFFTGTEVNCLTSPWSEWVLVEVGNQTGFMQSRYLRMESSGVSVACRQPTAAVSSSSVNLRASASLQGAWITALSRGETMTVLGETHDHWYFVRTPTDFGYVKSDYVTLR